jgi:hypothetical protein
LTTRIIRAAPYWFDEAAASVQICAPRGARRTQKDEEINLMKVSESEGERKRWSGRLVVAYLRAAA